MARNDNARVGTNPARVFFIDKKRAERQFRPGAGVVRNNDCGNVGYDRWKKVSVVMLLTKRPFAYSV
jgi:hypothetical protein